MKRVFQKIVDEIIFYGAILILLYSCISKAHALSLSEFPLWGQTWIIGEGENDWIYQSAARFRPNKVALVKFNEYSADASAIAAEIQYANLQTCDPMYSTAAAIDEMMKQFKDNKYEIRTNKYKKIKDTNEFIESFNIGDKISKYPGMFENLKESAEGGKILVPFGEIKSNNDYSPLHIEYYPYNDTLWTFHYYAKDLVGYKRVVIQYGSRETENLNFSDSVVFDNMSNRTVVGQYTIADSIKVSIWTQEKPKLTTYKEIKIQGNDLIFAQYDTATSPTIMKYDNNSDDDVYAQIFIPKNVDVTTAQDVEKLLIRKVRLDENGKIGYPLGYELIEQHSLDTAKKKVGEKQVFTTKNIGFWRLHITPEVWFFCRDRNGDTISIMNEGFRFWSNFPDTADSLKKYRKQFNSAVKEREKQANQINTGGINNSDDLMKANEWLSPVLSELSSTIISVSFMGGEYETATKIILESQDKELTGGSDLFFTHNPPRMYKIGNELNAIEKAAIKLHARDSLEEKEAEYLYDYCYDWKTIDNITTGYIFPEDSFPRKRNFDIDDAIFMYAGCPCDYDTITGMTPMQLRSYIYKPVPTHTLSLAEKALAVFNKLKIKILTAAEDQDILFRKIFNAKRIVDALNGTYEKIYGKDKNKFPTDCKNCPKTWLDDEPIKKMMGY